ncbi:MAG: helix-turn-helix domain-containing protein [Bacteroidales bacterium]
MTFESRFDIFALFMLLGFSQGIFLTYYFLNKKNRTQQATLFFGLFLAVSVILVSEILLNYTGLIVKVIFIENYSEAFVFLLAPLFYLIIKARLNDPYTPQDHVHFMPFIFYFTYCFLYFLQSPEFKFNSYVYCYHPNWDTLPVNYIIPEDPLNLRQSLAPLYLSQAFVYVYLVYVKLKYYPSPVKFKLFGRKDPVIKPLFVYWLHALAIALLIAYVKIFFDRDLGDYIIGSYISVLLYVSSFFVISRYHRQADQTDETEKKPKYEKSSLSELRKDEILAKLKELLGGKKYFTRNMLSLKETAKAINEMPHHVSQVINERTGKNFYDLLSEYRIKEAQTLLSDKANHNLTIEEIAEQVGYNSKAAFNKAFKSLALLTPSEFRRAQQSE